MKIVLVGTLSGMGPSRVLVGWARVLEQRGHDILIVADKLGDMADQLPSSDRLEVCLTEVSPRVPGVLRARFHARAVATKFAARIESFGPDAIVTTYRSETLALEKRFPRNEHGRPVHVATWHSPTFEEERLNLFTYGTPLKKLAFLALAKGYHSIDRDALKVVDAVHTLSHFTWRKLNSLYPIECRHKLWRRIPGSVLPEDGTKNPGRTEARSALGLSADELVFFAVRRLVPRNAPVRILDAAEHLARIGVSARFLVAGRGVLDEQLRQQISERGLSDRVRLLGFISDEDLRNYLIAADATLMPTEKLECFGLPAIESLAYGTPCLATPCGGLVEILAPFPKWLAAANSSVAFATVVERFAKEAAAQSDSDREQCAKELRSHVLANYSEQVVGCQIEGFLADVLAESTGDRRVREQILNHEERARRADRPGYGL